jgi:hypothetical protein
MTCKALAWVRAFTRIVSLSSALPSTRGAHIPVKPALRRSPAAPSFIFRGSSKKRKEPPVFKGFRFFQASISFKTDGRFLLVVVVEGNVWKPECSIPQSFKTLYQKRNRRFS